MGVQTPEFPSLIKSTYGLLGLASFLTAGEKTRAWTFSQGMTAPQCAGVIHTDFEKFLKQKLSPTMTWLTGSMQAARESGKWRLEGKDYLFEDGDVVLFKCNA